eukprot:g8281.t1
MITISRFLLAIVLFTLIYVQGFWRTAAVLFIVAAWTDFLDGYIARKYGMITVLGRILDPFVDKIIVGGAFIFLSEKTVSADGMTLHSGVNAWMAIIIIGREMFVTTLRSFLEQHGKDFSASWSGKIKMALQCIAVPASLFSLHAPYATEQFLLVRDILLWTAVGVFERKEMMHIKVLTIAAALTTLSFGTLSADDARQRAGVEFFEKHIRPLLLQKCVSCHGPKQQEAELRLDSRAALLKGSAEGPVVKSGRPKQSRLIEVISHTGEVKMPPERKLSAVEINHLTKWVGMGIPWGTSQSIAQKGDRSRAGKSHWAFQPVRHPPVPRVRDRAWSRSPIDRFVLSRLEQAGLRPSPRTDKRTLIRRVTFDLTGLPPTPAEVAAFLADDSPDAYDRLVDRLLASPRYGERWGRFWLDIARYADNKGYVFFEEKTFPWAYTYRDYVVRSFNEDLPYDRFILEQLAADQLDLAKDQTPLTAMGFLTLGGRFMNNLHDVIDDRIDVVTRGLMGVTVTCARCHDHKFDPIPQADYYAMYGVFRSSVEPTLPPTFVKPHDSKVRKAFQTEMQKRLKKLNDFVEKKHAELVASGKKRAAEYLLEVHARRNQPRTDDFMLLVPAGGLNPAMTLRWEVYLQRSKRRSDPVWSIWHRYAELPDQNFVQNAVRVTRQLSELEGDDAKANPLVLAQFINRPPTTMKDVADRYARLLHATEELWQKRQNSAKNSKSAPPQAFDNPQREQLRLVFHAADAPPNVPPALGWGFLSLLPDRPAQGVFKKLIKDVETWSIKGAGAPPRAMVLVDAPEPYRPRVFVRGNPNRPGSAVARRFLTVLDPTGKPFQSGSGRLELAKRIIDPKNPLTARVIVNRLWRYHFGQGIVATPSDFGLQGEPPTHPLLLDFLASELIRGGWSLKHMHRAMLRLCSL